MNPHFSGCLYLAHCPGKPLSAASLGFLICTMAFNTSSKTGEEKPRRGGHWKLAACPDLHHPWLPSEPGSLTPLCKQVAMIGSSVCASTSIRRGPRNKITQTSAVLMMARLYVRPGLPHSSLIPALREMVLSHLETLK